MIEIPVWVLVWALGAAWFVGMMCGAFWNYLGRRKAAKTGLLDPVKPKQYPKNPVKFGPFLPTYHANGDLYIVWSELATAIRKLEEQSE